MPSVDGVRVRVGDLEPVGGVDLGLELDRLDRRALQPQRLRAVAASPPVACTCSVRVSVSGLYCSAITEQDAGVRVDLHEAAREEAGREGHVPSPSSILRSRCREDRRRRRDGRSCRQPNMTRRSARARVSSVARRAGSSASRRPADREAGAVVDAAVGFDVGVAQHLDPLVRRTRRVVRGRPEATADSAADEPGTGLRRVSGRWGRRSRRGDAPPPSRTGPDGRPRPTRTVMIRGPP